MTDEPNDKELRELIQQLITPVQDTELRRDLWPQMLERLSRQPVRVPWFDWILAAVLGAALLFFPSTIPALLYHL